MIRLTSDPKEINAFANHPDINPAIAGVPVDFTGAIRETNIFYVGAFGCFCFEWKAPGVYEGHVMLLKAGRGAWGVAAARHALRALNATVWARVAPDNRVLTVFVRRVGFRLVESRHLYPSDAAELFHIYEWRPECPL